MIAALCRLYRCSRDPRYLDAAKRAQGFLENSLCDQMCIRDRFFYYGNGYWQKGIPAQPEDMDAYEALENKIMEKYDLKEPFIWT